MVPVAPGRYMTDKIPMGRTGKLHEASGSCSGRLLRHVTFLDLQKTEKKADSSDFLIIIIIIIYCYIYIYMEASSGI